MPLGETGSELKRAEPGEGKTGSEEDFTAGKISGTQGRRLKSKTMRSLQIQPQNRKDVSPGVMCKGNTMGWRKPRPHLHPREQRMMQTNDFSL